MTTDLSVVIALHDAAEHLPVALASLARNVEAPDGPSLQLIAVDDGSTDATPDLLAEAAGYLPGLEVVRLPAPTGAASARNVGLDHARGRLVTFADGDDWLAPDHFATLVAAIDALDVDFVRTDHVQVRGTERVLHRAPGRHGRVLDPRAVINPLQRETMIDYPFSWAGVYRASLGDALRWQDGLRTATDRPWIWQLHLGARSFATIDHAGVYYRREVAGSLTTIGDERRLHVFDAYQGVLRLVAGEPDLQPKAVRQFLGLIARHLSMADVYEPAARQRFDDRARQALAGIDTAVLRAAMVPDRKRRDLLASYLPAGVL